MRLRRTTLSVLLTAALLASLTGGISASASGPGATAAKKCKKGYKKNKHGKCVKKKFKAKLGLYTSKDGTTRLRVDAFLDRTNPRKPKRRVLVRLFGTPAVPVTCSNGQKTMLAIGGFGGPTAILKGKKFKAQTSTSFTFSGKFSSTKSLKAKWSTNREVAPGITCASGTIAFKAKRTGN